MSHFFNNKQEIESFLYGVLTQWEAPGDNRLTDELDFWFTARLSGDIVIVSYGYNMYHACRQQLGDDNDPCYEEDTPMLSSAFVWQNGSDMDKLCEFFTDALNEAQEYSSQEQLGPTYSSPVTP